MYYSVIFFYFPVVFRFPNSSAPFASFRQFVERYPAVPVFRGAGAGEKTDGDAGEETKNVYGGPSDFL